MRVARHGIARGRVQGVGYRYFARVAAGELGLDGWVKNLDDGRVEFAVAGEEAAIAEFLERLRRGPRFARVDGVEDAQFDAQEITAGAGFRVER